jgi:hypothetical protein
MEAISLFHRRVEQGLNGPDGAKGMREPGVRCARVDLVRRAELLDTAQALEGPTVDDLHLQPRQTDVAMNRVRHDLAGAEFVGGQAEGPRFTHCLRIAPHRQENTAGTDPERHGCVKAQLCLPIYCPERSALDGSWMQPPVTMA